MTVETAETTETAKTAETAETVEMTMRNSPLGHRSAELAATPAAVHLREVPFLAQLDLRLDAEGPSAQDVGATLGTRLPSQPNTTGRSGDLDVLWLGPDEWLVVAPGGAPEELEASLRLALGTQDGIVVDVSAQRTVIEISGPRAREVLAKGCSLDLHPSVFTQGRCAQVLLARAQVLLLSRGGDVPTYWLLVRASFATYVADWLLDASLEYAEGDSRVSPCS